MMPSYSHNSANFSGVHLKHMPCGTDSRLNTTNILPRTLKQRSAPHCRFSVASANDRQYSRIASTFMGNRNPRKPRMNPNLIRRIAMQTKQLGNSDLQITAVGYGAWAIGGSGWQFAWGSQDDNESISALHRALELGVNWIDTAAVYGLGHPEEVVARALQEWQGPRPYVFTKCGMIWNGQGNVDYSLRQESIRRECEASLRRLKTDVIDLYQIHWTARSE